MDPDVLLQLRSLRKSFGGVHALDGVSLTVRRGQCHALMGENGAGKSTLGKILAGIHRPDAGLIFFRGREVHFSSPRAAAAAGIAMVHQELAFCPDLSLAENLCMGRYPRVGRLFVSRRAMRRRARELLAQIGVDLDVNLPMRALSTAQEQLAQIAAAVGTEARLIVLDEPTSSLSDTEAGNLFRLINDLRRRAVTIIYVSHRLPEVLQLCDAISVLRDGKYVGTLSRDQATEDHLVQLMIGRTLKSVPAPDLPGQGLGKELLRVKELSSPGKFADVSFNVHAGEIVGFAGLVGSGRSEVATALFGLDRQAHGQVRLCGRDQPLGRVRRAMRQGMGLVPEDRKRQGLVLKAGGRHNFSLAMLKRFSRLRFMTPRAEKLAAWNYFSQLRIKTPSLDTPVESLSGGNQQKVALAKWLARDCKVLIVDEPTRGVDVGAKEAIHDLLAGLARKGVAVMLISSELEEVLKLSTRVIVMRAGAIVAQMPRAEATRENVLRLMAGV